MTLGRRVQPPRRRRGGWRLRGDGPVEFAILALPTLLLSFMLVQAGAVWYANSVALGAATQGANAARSYGSNAGAGTTRANQFLVQIGVLTKTHVETRQQGNEMICVVSGTAPQIIPGFTFTVTKSARGPIERWVP